MNSYMAVTTIVIFPISRMKQKNDQRQENLGFVNSCTTNFDYL